jgi:hypothetical protein
MTTKKRRVDVFTAGCPLCEGRVRFATYLVCHGSEVRAMISREGCATNQGRGKAALHGVTAVRLWR